MTPSQQQERDQEVEESFEHRKLATARADKLADQALADLERIVQDQRLQDEKKQQSLSRIRETFDFSTPKQRKWF